MIEVYSAFSSDFVSPLFPKKGEDVELSIVFSSFPDEVLLKYDSATGLVFNKKMERRGEYNGMVRYSAVVPASLDETNFHYYFVFFLDGASYYYSKKGITRIIPSIKNRFSLITGLNAPDWVARATCYQIFPDRFFSSGLSRGAKKGEYEFDGGVVTTPKWTDTPKSWNESRCCDFYNGDLKGIEEKVDYLSSLGVNALYINPIFSSRSVHRYDTVDFFSVDEKLGGDEALISLVNTMHKRSIKVILDISINHTGLEGVWLKKAIEDPESEERGFYYFNSDGSVRCWQDVKTLPQLNYNSEKLREYMYRGEHSVMKKYLAEPYNIDGWRLDVAPEVARSGTDQMCMELWADINRELKSFKKGLYLVGEDWDDSAPYLDGDIWDGTMNYYGCGRPIRSWMGEKDRFLSEKGEAGNPGVDKSWNGYELSDALNEALMSVPGQTAYFQMNLFDSHDTPRLHNNSRVYDRDIYKGVVMLQYMLPGMPSTYYGDEIQNEGKISSNEGARYPFEWREEREDSDMLSYFRKLGKIRNSNKEFFYSAVRIRPLDESAVVVERIGKGFTYAAVINKGGKRKVSLDGIMPSLEKASILLGEGKAEIKNGKLSLSLEEKKSLLILLEE